MIDKQERLQNRLIPEMQEFRDACQTLQLATVNKEGLPSATYAPFAFNESGFFILVSDLAAHGQNLKHNKNLSIMLIDDEQNAKHIFARRRLSFETVAEEVLRDDDTWSQGILALENRFGEFIENLSSLGDFRLYLLTPDKGRYVKGFGQAFDVSGFDMVDIVHLNEGHVKALKEAGQDHERFSSKMISLTISFTCDLILPFSGAPHEYRCLFKVLRKNQRPTSISQNILSIV